MNDALLSLVEREVLGWPGTSSAPGRFGSVAFRYGRREIGHVHRDLIADLPVTQEIRERLLSGGRARPHRAGLARLRRLPDGKSRGRLGGPGGIEVELRTGEGGRRAPGRGPRGGWRGMSVFTDEE